MSCVSFARFAINHPCAEIVEEDVAFAVDVQCRKSDTIARQYIHPEIIEHVDGSVCWYHSIAD
eukprot:SAG31_NODE_14757_length_789_cov_0.866667_2_plen_62_part_01